MTLGSRFGLFILIGRLKVFTNVIYLLVRPTTNFPENLSCDKIHVCADSTSTPRFLSHYFLRVLFVLEPARLSMYPPNNWSEKNM